jgi:hypothetical protein
VDQIEGHVRSRDDAIFKIKWKSGDVTWMPYYQIAHLEALEAYLDLIGVDKIYDLPAGTATDSNQDPQLFLGGLSIAQPTAAESLYSGSQSSHACFTAPSHFTHTCSTSSHTHTSYTLMSEYGFNFNHTLLTRDGRDHWYLTDILDKSRRIFYTSYQLRDFIRYDKSLRESNVANQPGGYHEFVDAFNDPSGCCPIKFTSIAGETTPGTPPDIYAFRIDPTSMRARTARIHAEKPRTKPTQSRSASPKPTTHVGTPVSTSLISTSDGGMILDSYEADITRGLLLRTAGQVLRRDRAIHERLNRRSSSSPYSTPPPPEEPKKQHRKKKSSTARTRESSPITASGSADATRSMSVDRQEPASSSGTKTT